MVEDIDDPIKGIAKCNEHIRKLEMMIEEAREKDDLVAAMKGEGHLVAWTELLEHFIRQKFQQGYSTEDISKAGKKRRYEGRTPQADSG